MYYPDRMISFDIRGILGKFSIGFSQGNERKEEKMWITKAQQAFLQNYGQTLVLKYLFSTTVSSQINTLV